MKRVETETHVDVDRGKDERATDTYISICLRAGNKIDVQSKAIAETDLHAKGPNRYLGITYRGILDGWALSCRFPAWPAAPISHSSIPMERRFPFWTA